jgi:K+-sensing histidine kinase KdpD
LDAGGYKMDKQIFDISMLMQSNLSELIKRYPARKFEPTIEEQVMMNGDAFVLGLVLNNLLENAVKYTKADVLISLILKTENNKILISIVDEGEGIPDREKSRIFDKFYRMGDETKRKTKGTGLGLYLSSKIVHDHGGTIKVTDNHPQGAIFTIAFPKG